MPKYYTPFDKQITELFNLESNPFDPKTYGDALRNVFSDDESEEEKKKRMEQDKQKVTPELKSSVPEFVTTGRKALEKVVGIPLIKEDIQTVLSFFESSKKEQGEQQLEDSKILGEDIINVFPVDSGRLVTNAADRPGLKEKLEILNAPARVSARLLEQRERNQVSDVPDLDIVEEFLLGTSPLDRQGLAPAERIFRKTGDAVGEAARAAVAGTVRGAVVIPQLAQIVNKYGMGTLEQGFRWVSAGFDNEAFVDYDLLESANTAMKHYSEASEKFIKTVDEAMDVDELGYSSKILMYVTDFAIPLNIPGKIAKTMALTGQVASDFYRSYRGTPAFRPEDPIFYDKYVQAQPIIMSAAEKNINKNFNKALEEARKVNPEVASNLESMAKYSATAEDMLNKKAKLYNKAISDLDSFYKDRPLLERMRERLQYPQGTRKGITVANYKRTEEGDFVRDEKGKKVLQEVQVFERQLTLEERVQKETLRKIMNGNAVVGAGAVAGAWDHAFEGTQYQDLSYIMGIMGAFANPSATMRVVEAMMDVTIGKGVQQLGIPFVKVPGTRSDGSLVERPLSLAYAAYGIGKALHTQLLKEDEVANFEKTPWARKLSAMAMGVPFYKALMFDDTIKIDELGGLTELQAATTFSSREFKYLEKFSKDIVQYLPEEYIQSYQLLMKKGEELIANINNSENADKTTDFIITLEQLMKGILLNSTLGVLTKASNDKDFKGSVGGMKHIMGIFRTLHQEADMQKNFIKNSLENLVGGLEKGQSTFEELKRGGDIIMNAISKNLRELDDQIRNVDAQYSIVNKGTHNELEELFEGEQGFNLVARFGRDPEKSRALDPEKLDQFYEDINDTFTTVYNKAEEVKDSKWNALEDAIQDRDMQIDDLIDTLQILARSELDDFGDVASILKDKQKFINFGKVTKNFEPGQQLSHNDNINLFIKSARFNGLELIDTVSQLKAIGDDIVESGVSVKFDDSGSLVVTQKADGSIDLQKTLNEARDNAEESGLSLEDYYRYLYTGLTPNNFNDIKQFDSFFPAGHVVKAIDLHNLRKSFSQWSWRNQGRPASFSIYDQAKVMDRIFEDSGVPELQKANKEHTDFKRVWHESFLGRAMQENPDLGFNKEEFYNLSRNTRGRRDYLYSLFNVPVENLKQSKKVFDDLFMDKEFADKTKVSFETEKNKLLEELDTVVAHGVQSGRIYLGSNKAAQLEKINALENVGLISNKSAELLRMYTQYTAPVSEYKISKEIEDSLNNVNRVLKNITDDQKKAIEGSIGATLQKITDLDSLVDFLFPQKGTPTYAKTASFIDEFGETANLDDLRRSSEGMLEKLERVGRPAIDREGRPITLDTIDANLKEIKSGSLAAESGSRFKAILKHLYDVDETDRLNPANPKDQDTIRQLKDLRDAIVSTIIRRSVYITNERKSSLDLAFKEREEEIGALSRFSRKRPADAFRLNTDFDISEMMSMYIDAEKSLKSLDKIMNRNADFTDDLEDLLAGLVAIKGQVPDELLGMGIENVPKGLTYPAALSRLYAGFRGVVSWRFLVTEQIVREHQRSKHLFFHKVLSDPKFVETLGLVINKRNIGKEGKELLAKAVKDIMLVTGSRAVVYDADAEDGKKYDPSPDEIVNALSEFWLSDPLLAAAQTLYPPKDIVEGDLEYYKIDEPQGILQNILPIGVRRGLSESEIDVLRADETPSEQSAPPPPESPSTPDSEMMDMLRGIN